MTRRTKRDYSWIMEILFLVLGCVAWGMGAPAVVVVLLLAAGGLLFICTQDSDDSSDWNIF